jgi:hypothetical protein
MFEYFSRNGRVLVIILLFIICFIITIYDTISNHIGSILFITRGRTIEEHIVKTQDNYILGIHRIATGKSYCDKEPTESHIRSIFKNCGIPLSAIRTSYSSSTKKIKPVVLLYHGLMMCSEVWMCNMEEERQLPFLLADAGYVP